ncbi:NB-ARC domain, LRR domain containing protein [Parasponia andersonii]|uniref:NB-ARC domain, LRR domain containing protein n=1 Tax=Parasponia andersonii TaxID=3476 RepID=A0A2P5BS48_PARAD|nr:NB-ARC domain, LRR domain containing protein [Parasponia andersonii]
MEQTFLGPVIQKLAELLAEEANLLKGVHKEAGSLKDDLEIIQPFLKDAEAKLEKGELGDASKVWIKQLREKADHIEDVVDEYIHHLRTKICRPEHGFVHFVRKTCHFAKSIKPRHDIASEIQDIKGSLREIKERGQSFGLRPFEQGSSGKKTTNVDASTGLRLGSLYIKEDDLVGIDSKSKELISSLVEGPSTRVVTSLVGEGGIGKTTLAKKVYDDDEIKRHFDCRAWVTVSQSYNVEKILKIMKSQICHGIEKTLRDNGSTIEELIDLLRDCLETKRYVVVFDDVWERDFWEVIKHAFPTKNKADRIIITTRNASISNSIKETPFDIVHELKPLSSELVWELFCKKAFPFEPETQCPKELDHLSHEIIQKCNGLPLVIVAIAGLLSTKEKIEFEWRQVLDNLNYEFENNPQLTSVSTIIFFSYHDLPYHLKSCFLYFGMLPEDYSIFDQRLYRLWIAEGFIESRRGKTLEKVAQEYLNELINRNLVSCHTRFGFQRRCQVHDLMRDFILARVDELCFSQILDKGKARFKGKSRRLSVYNTTKDALEILRGSEIRSIIFNNVDELTESFAISLFKNFKLLKLLDFQGAPMHNIPKEVGNLFHLKYLSLHGTKVKFLPKSIGNLYNLQTLNLCNTLVEEIPKEINKLRNLQRLLAQRYSHEIECSLNSYGSVRIHEGIRCLEDLLTLTFVEANDDGVDFVKELGKLTKLETFGIGKVTAAMGKELGTSIGNMNHLEELFINSIREEETLDFNCILSPPCSLRFLSLRCRLEVFPNWISMLQNLTGLSLRFTRLIDEPLKHLKDLPNLAFIRLYQAYDGEELHFEEGGFRKLKEVLLGKLEGLKVVKIDRGTLPVLENFQVEACLLMQEIPSNIKHLQNLKSLIIKDMPREFVAGLQPNGGPHYSKIKHVPSVSIQYKYGEWTKFQSYKLGEPDLLQRLQ